MESIQKLEEQLDIMRDRKEKSDDMIDRLRSDVKKLQLEGCESATGSLKIELYDEFELNLQCKCEIEELEKRLVQLSTRPGHTEPGPERLGRPDRSEMRNFEFGKSPAKEFCPLLDRSRTDKQQRNPIPSTPMPRTSTEAGQLMTRDIKTVIDRESMNETKISALEKDVETLLEGLRTRKAQEVTSPMRQVKQSVVRGIKPHRFKKGDEICTFLERFEQYVIVNNIHDGNMDLLLLSLIDDDKIYKKLRNVELSVQQRTNVGMLVDKMKESLFPITETRIMRSELARLAQNQGESVEDFALRVEDLAGKAYSDLRLREEACVSRLMEGSKSGVVRQKLMESDATTFENAKLIAIKQERITETIAAQEETKPLIDFDTPVYRMEGENNNLKEEKAPQANIEEQWSRPLCAKCGKSGHDGNSCWQDVTCQLCGIKGHVASVCKSDGPFSSTPRKFSTPSDNCYGCGGRGHMISQCPTVGKSAQRPTSRSDATRGYQDPERRVTCYGCGLPGHYKSQCPGVQQYSRRDSGSTAENRGRGPQSYESRRGQRDYLNGYAAGGYPAQSSRDRRRF